MFSCPWILREGSPKKKGDIPLRKMCIPEASFEGGIRRFRASPTGLNFLLRHYDFSRASGPRCHQNFSLWTLDMSTSPVSSLTRTAEMIHLPSPSGAKRLSLVFVCLGAFLFVATPALSQELRDRGREAPQERSTSESTPNLPDWAAPSNSRSQDRRFREGSGGGSDASSMEGTSVDGSMRPNAPPPGDVPVPVDGGLALLAAAGAGYAVRRLRKEEDGEPDLP